MDKEEFAEQSNIVKGSIYAVVAFFCMAVFGIFSKVALQGGSIFWVSFIVYLTGTLTLVPFIIYRGGLSYLKSSHYFKLVGRAIFGTIASFLYTVSILYIPIVNGTLLFNTAPLFIPLLMTVFLKKTVSKSTWWAVLIGFIGIIIIIKPTEAIFTQTGNLVGLFSGFSLAIAYLLMKSLSGTDPNIRIIFYYLGIGTLMQIPALFFVGEFPSFLSCIYAIFGGLWLLAAQLVLVAAYSYAGASQIGIYQYMSVIFVGVFDWLLWNSVPTIGELVGVVLVTLAGVIVIKNGRINLHTSHPE
jgi:drug/metabolite transporter (DMT)-like permease